MNTQLSEFLLSRFTICFTLCKLFHFACQISLDMAIWLLQLGQFCCERFFICSAVERTNALISHTKLERWTYSRGPVEGERGAHVPCRDFKTHLLGFWGESHIPVGILLFDYYCTFLLWCGNFNTSSCHLSPFQLSIPAWVDTSTFRHTTTGFSVKQWLQNTYATDNQLYLQQTGSLHVSGKLPPTPPLSQHNFCPKWEVSVNVGLGEG